MIFFGWSEAYQNGKVVNEKWNVVIWKVKSVYWFCGCRTFKNRKVVNKEFCETLPQASAN